MASPNKFDNTINVIAQGGINFALDNFKVMLTNTLPMPTDSVYGDLSPGELPPGNGYVTGGFQATLISSGQVAGAYTLKLNSVQWVGGPGNMGPFQYAVLYDFSNLSIANKPLVCWWPYPSSIFLAPTETFTLQLNPLLGVVQMN